MRPAEKFLPYRPSPECDAIDHAGSFNWWICTLGKDHPGPHRQCSRNGVSQHKWDTPAG
jgi:hypothetical protein